MAQKQIPGGAYVSEVGNQKQIPGGVYINETASGGAALVAAPVSVSTVTATLTTQIVLAANLASVSTVTADLLSNNIYAAAISISTATATLTTQINLNATLVSVSAATASLTTSSGVGWSTSPLKNNAGTVLANETGVIANIYNTATGALVLRKTGLSSDASGIVSIRDFTATLVASTVYSYELVLVTNGRRLPTATAS